MKLPIELLTHQLKYSEEAVTRYKVDIDGYHKNIASLDLHILTETVKIEELKKAIKILEENQ